MFDTLTYVRTHLHGVEQNVLLQEVENKPTIGLGRCYSMLILRLVTVRHSRGYCCIPSESLGESSHAQINSFALTVIQNKVDIGAVPKYFYRYYWHLNKV